MKCIKIIGSRFAAFLCLLIPVLIFQSCDINSSTPDTDSCILSSIQFDAINTIHISTVSGGKIFEVFQEANIDGETEIVASFRFIYQPDSISIRNLLSSGDQFQSLGIKLEDDRPVQVIKSFSGQGIQLIHDVTYPSNQLVRVDLTRIASNGDSLIVGFSNYHKDNNGNVRRYERYSADRSNPEFFTLEEDLIFTYDDFESPVNGYYLPFFNNTGFPDARFFSNGNITSISQDSSTVFFENEYGREGQLLSQKQVNGPVVFFEYANC